MCEKEKCIKTEVPCIYSFTAGSKIPSISTSKTGLGSNMHWQFNMSNWTLCTCVLAV